MEKPDVVLMNLPQVSQAVDDLATMLGIAPSTIDVVSVENHLADGSLDAWPAWLPAGCSRMASAFVSPPTLFLYGIHSGAKAGAISMQGSG